MYTYVELIYLFYSYYSLKVRYFLRTVILKKRWHSCIHLQKVRRIIKLPKLLGLEANQSYNQASID
jgi:hypothetical protein